jgi:16S rRNA (uracil1498-N3)-methyltransferase
MPDLRAFGSPVSTGPSVIVLSSEESHHLVAVNRAKRGDPVIAFDGRGHEWVCELTEARSKAAVLGVRSARTVKPLPYEITLGQSLPLGPFMDSIVRKATEIGVVRIVPLETERTQVHLDDARSERKVEKWRTAALEAAKQCGNAYVPEVSPPRGVTAFMASAQGYDLKLIASLAPGARSLKTVLGEYRSARQVAPRKVLWLIGPEGDFTTAEMSASRSAGFEPISLGPLVLRCETAAVYALSVLSHELQSG